MLTLNIEYYSFNWLECKVATPVGSTSWKLPQERSDEEIEAVPTEISIIIHYFKSHELNVHVTFL